MGLNMLEKWKNMINLEIKVATSNIEEIKRKILEIEAKDFDVLSQTDTYFIIGEKRLKLREEKDKSYLVFYVRPNTSNSKFSKYYIVNIPLYFSKIIKKILSFIFGLKVVVSKKRNLFIYKNTRIHLDEVKDLGSFMELETVFKDGVNENKLKSEHEFVVNFLGLNTLKSIKESYSDLLLLNK